MQLLFAFTAWLSLSQAIPSAPFTSRADPEVLSVASTDLQPILSKDAKIVLPNGADWAELQIRGTSPRISPKYNVVVEVATEQDVVNTVQIANKYGIPFLAVSGTHGWTKTLNNLPFGIQINMRKLNTASVDQGGKTATVGGGMLQWELTRALFAANKQAVTGLCECVSIIGPLMGGGHSMLQARHGFALDNIVSARVVLANGTAVTASNTKNADLFWAVRGAGHNFGVVTSMVLNIYDIQKNWTVYSLIFTQDKIEQLFNTVNDVDARPDRPSNMFLTGVTVRIPGIDAANPVIAYTVGFEGTQDEAAPWAAPFQALGPAVTQIDTDVDYVSLYTVTQNNLDSTACRRNLNAMGSGASLPTWNTTAIRNAYNVFSTMTADSRFNSSVLLLESYGMQGVKAVDSSSTSLALEERQYPNVANPTIWWAGNDAKTTADGYAYGDKIRNAFFAGVGKAKKHTYVNYAIGTESFEQMYGYEDWRVKKLKSLKKSLDPKNKFGYYNPVPAA